MATSGILYGVYVLPIIFSIVLGSIVMGGILQEPDRELNMWPGSSKTLHNDKSIQLIGLAQQYSDSTPVKILINVDDASFDCGDLYVTIYSSDKKVVTQSGFLDQCFIKNKSTLPMGEEFSEIIEVPGKYELVAEMSDKAQKHTISASGKFTVK